MQIHDLLDRFYKKDRRGLARLLSLIENRDPHLNEILDTLYPSTGDAWRIGFTGPPGAGKSTLVNQTVLKYRELKEEVGVIAFDPTSPFTGGALLGDRIRMSKISLDPGVFIRSMATRGHLGGLAVGVDEACDLMDAFGKEKVLIETVGVGQSELEVAHSADTTVVVLVPQSGDAIQAMKAGLMEIADIFVLNKCDRDGADKAYRELVSILYMKETREGWEPPVIKTIAESGEGLDEFTEMIQKHRDFLVETGLLKKKRREVIAAKIRRIVEEELRQQCWKGERETKRTSGLGDHKSPYTLANSLLEEFYQEIKDGKNG